MNGGIHELNLNGLSDTVSGMLQEANVASQLWACTVLVPAATFFLSGPPGFLLTPALSSATCSRSVNLACVGSRVLIRVLGNRQCELGRYWRLLPVGTLGCLLGRTVHASGTLLAVITATEVLFCTFWAVRSCGGSAALTQVGALPRTT
ncbi:MAG: uncharacterized protein KVP18_001024 [Porospora cf. gigantea A]|uniref:uncharacterized protein n=1 Tax=Porospora cf. gigantea A TaxID=2853593 RepID=UPI00355AA069|nr:MAG: hypothetical protein KVP18_001024 [Porospora cf. gigantea A]